MVDTNVIFSDSTRYNQNRTRNGRSSVDIGSHLKLLKSKIRSLSGLPERTTISIANTQSRLPASVVRENPPKTTVNFASTPPLRSKRTLITESSKLQSPSLNIHESPAQKSSPLLMQSFEPHETMNRAETVEEQIPSSTSEKLVKCIWCSRTFRDDVIEKHGNVCAKNQQINRPKFDSKTHRLAGIQAGGKPILSPFMAAASGSNHNKQVSVDDTIPIKRPSWRDKSDQLRAAIGAARSSDPRDRLRYEQELARVNQQCLTRCDYCGRSFNADAAARHIPICRNKAQMMPRKTATRPIEKTVAEVTARALAKSAAAGSVVPLAASNRTRPGLR